MAEWLSVEIEDIPRVKWREREEKNYCVVLWGKVWIRDSYGSFRSYSWNLQNECRVGTQQSVPTLNSCYSDVRCSEFFSWIGSPSFSPSRSMQFHFSFSISIFQYDESHTYVRSVRSEQNNSRRHKKYLWFFTICACALRTQQIWSVSRVVGKTINRYHKQAWAQTSQTEHSMSVSEKKNIEKYHIFLLLFFWPNTTQVLFLTKNVKTNTTTQSTKITR